MYFTIYHFGILEGVLNEFCGLLFPSDLHSLEKERKKKSQLRKSFRLAGINFLAIRQSFKN